MVSYNGIDVAVKDSKRFSKSERLGLLHLRTPSICHMHKQRQNLQCSECAGCHIANVANTDMTYIKFYPLLRDKDKIKKLTGEYY